MELATNMLHTPLTQTTATNSEGALFYSLAFVLENNYSLQLTLTDLICLCFQISSIFLSFKLPNCKKFFLLYFNILDKVASIFKYLSNSEVWQGNCFITVNECLLFICIKDLVAYPVIP